MSDMQSGIKEICQAHGNDRARMMDIVQAVQARYGCVNDEAIDLIAAAVDPRAPLDPAVVPTVAASVRLLADA